MNIKKLFEVFKNCEEESYFTPVTGRILNLTQHSLTPAQIAQGAFEPSAEDKSKISKLLTVDELISQKQLNEKSMQLLEIASKYEFDYLLVGGMHPLINTVAFFSIFAEISTCQAFTKRMAVEVENADGTISKKTVFAHEKFYKFS